MVFLLENATAETATEAEQTWIDALVKYKHDFIAAMDDDDINTADAIAVLLSWFGISTSSGCHFFPTGNHCRPNLFAELTTVLPDWR